MALITPYNLKLDKPYRYGREIFKEQQIPIKLLKRDIRGKYLKEYIRVSTILNLN
jgi:hypothetical protein